MIKELQTELQEQKELIEKTNKEMELNFNFHNILDCLVGFFCILFAAYYPRY